MCIRDSYNHEGGLVTMKVGSECVEGGLANAAYQTVVRVSDTGPGLSLIHI